MLLALLWDMNFLTLNSNFSFGEQATLHSVVKILRKLIGR